MQVTFLTHQEVPAAGMSEDFLFMNVWIPDNRQAAPVMFFVHGAELPHPHRLPHLHCHTPAAILDPTPSS